MKGAPKLNVELNLRTRAWGIGFDERNLYLAAIHNKLNQIRYQGHELLEDYESKSDDEIQEFLDDFLRAHGVKRGDTYLTIPRNQVLIHITEFPREAKNNLEEVMEYQLGNFFPGDLDSYQFFPQILGEADQLLKVMIVAVKKEHLGHAFGLIRRWKLKLAGMTLETFALANGLLKSDPKRCAESKIVVFRFFATGLEMIALNSGRLVLSHYLPLSDEEDPHNLIVELERGFSQARIEPNEVNTYLSAGVPRPKLLEFLGNEVGIPFTKWVDSTGREVDPEGLACFGGSVSAVHDNPPLGLNMLPENQRKRHQRVPVILGSVALVLLALFWIVGEFREYRDLREQVGLLQRRHGQVTQRMNEVLAAKSGYEEKVEELEIFRGYRAGNLLIRVLDTMSRDLPDNTYLTNFQIKNGNKLTIQGESDDPFTTQRVLTGMPFLKDVTPGNAITPGRNRDGKKRFMFRAKIVLEALR